MNGLSDPHPPLGVPLTAHVNPGGAPRVSPALLRGAMELTAIFEQRTAKLRSEYDEKIRILVQERDAALARTPVSSQEERNAIAKERAACKSLQQQVEALQKENEELKEAIRTLLDPAMQMQGADVDSTELDELVMLLAEQSNHDAIEIIPPASPARSTTLPTLASSSTLSTLTLPSQEPVPMQVRASPPLLPLPFDDFFINLSPTCPDFNLEPSLGLQLDPPLPAPAPAPRSPRMPASLRTPPSPARSQTARSGSASRSPAAVGGTSRLDTATSTRKSPKWKLIIRIPQSNEPPRKLIKPPLTPPPPGEIMEVLHWPCEPDDEEGDDGATLTEVP
ncbi:hypothetical protein L226DRAFT_612468 [Lentinus tigrinus ALCF2SS1-7]|uniref:uncharacterized protein n=1 Tax=Lentinus tigrinus ALCF2SS1-7 TaxID=1328758 RepID=UPI001165ED75|nr:hypothetical protein L226DRAFT_612468 [Lentinus tigrinus ALCF2SS1-7]